MKRLSRTLLPLLVLGTSIAIAVALMASGLEAKRRRPETAIPSVEVLTVESGRYQVHVKTQGSVMPRTQTSLVPEVAGRIVEVSDAFRNGGFFETGQFLFRIDPRDYQTTLTVVGAEVAQRRLALAEEQARAAQARRDWVNLGLQGDPTPLVLRQPQVESAAALLAAAEARLQQARLNLERTTLVAPYPGRVLEKKVDVGQFVSSGTVCGIIYAVDYVEIRLPLANDQLGFLDLPETYRGDVAALDMAGPQVDVKAAIGGRDYHWTGQVVRTEGAIDLQSRQLFAVAQVADPYARHGDRPPLKVGQYVETAITGRLLEDVFILPRAAIRNENVIYVVDSESRLQRRQLDVVWRDRQHAVVTGPLQSGERISMTTLAFAADGAVVKVVGEDKSPGGNNRTGTP